MARAQQSSTALIIVLALAALGVGVFAVRMVTRTPANQASVERSPGAATAPDPAKPDDTLNAVLALQRDRRWPEAKALLEASIARNVQDQSLYIQLAEVNVGLEDFEAAYAAYEKALAIGPREGELEFAAATAANAANRLDRAVEHYQAAEAALKNDHRPPLFLSQVLIKLNRFDEAKVRLRRVQMLKPDEPIAHGSMAEIFLRENLPDLAIQTVAEARRLQPDYLTWRLVEARARKRKGQAQEALDLLKDLPDAQKLEAGVMPLMGECFGMLRRPTDAAETFAALSNQFPQRGDLALDTALWYERAGEKAKARTYAERAKMLAVAGAEDVLARLE
jgi:tetratricopeptide (TPR) repeat protein